MQNFMVEQNQFPSMHEYVFGAVIAVNQGIAARQRFGHEIAQESGSFRNSNPTIFVVRFQTERLKKVTVLEFDFEFSFSPVTFTVEMAE